MKRTDNKNIKIATILVCLSLLLGLFFPNSQTAFAGVGGRSVCLVDGESGMCVYQENADEVKEMASTTKIYTAFFALEKCRKDGIDLQKLRTIKSEWTGIEGSSIYLLEGEEVSIEELLYGLLLRSGNDSAVAIAGIVFGGEKEFCEYANRRLVEMGFENTALKNPHGLPAEGHHTTAKELAMFSKIAMKNEDFCRIVSAKSYSGKRTLYANKNKILHSVEGGNGVKTGYTKNAGRCLVSSAKRDGNQIVCCVLNSADMFERSRVLLDSFFQNYKYIDLEKELAKTLVDVDIARKSVPAKTLSGITKVPIKKGEKFAVKIETTKFVPFFAKAGTACGKMEIYLGEKLIFSDKLVTKTDASEI